MNTKNNMEDQIVKALETETPVVETPVVEKIKVGEDEYTQDELQSLLSIGKIGKEAEEKWNTKIDSLFPAYSKSQNEKKELEDKLAAMETKAPVIDPNAQPDEIETARKYLKDTFGLIDKSELDKEFDQKYQTARAGEKLLEKMNGFAGEIKGDDGRPAFKTEEILTYMRDEGIKDPMTAYKLKHESQLDAWKAQELGKTKKPGIITEESSTAGGKVPADVRITRDNLQDVLKEALG